MESVLRDVFVLTILILTGDASAWAAPPPIGQGLPSNIREAGAEFDRRVQARFPVGSDENELRAELARLQGGE